MTAYEHHKRWLAKPGNREKYLKWQAEWRAKPENRAKMNAYKKRYRAAKRAANRPARPIPLAPGSGLVLRDGKWTVNHVH